MRPTVTYSSLVCYVTSKKNYDQLQTSKKNNENFTYRPRFTGTSPIHFDQDTFYT